MKILFASNRFPYPPFRGDKLKIFNLAKRLCNNHELHLITFLEHNDDKQYLDELYKIFKKIILVPHPTSKKLTNVLISTLGNLPLQVGYFQSKLMTRSIDKLLNQEQYDVVHIQHLRLAQYWHNIYLPRILDLPDAYSLYWKRRSECAKGWHKWFDLLEYKRVKNYEKIINRFEKSLVCSKEDSKYLQDVQGISNVSILPNGVDCTEFSFPENSYDIENTILFTGNMDYEPNVDAVVYFSKDILPAIVDEVPGVKFIIAGQRPVEKVKSLASDRIIVTGFVEDLRTLYKKATMVAAPLRIGAGTQNKVLEAMAMGIPVVSHNVGFSGLNVSSGEGVYLAENIQEFVNYCVQLLKSKELRQKVGIAGREAAHNQFDWDAIALKLELYFNEVSNLKKKTID